jgi:hypothetical protein
MILGGASRGKVMIEIGPICGLGMGGFYFEIKKVVFWDVASLGLARTDGLEERVSSIFRVERIREL